MRSLGENTFLIVGDDQQVLIWDIQPMPQPIEVPNLSLWSRWRNQSSPDWICTCYRDNVEIQNSPHVLDNFGHAAAERRGREREKGGRERV